MTKFLMFFLFLLNNIYAQNFEGILKYELNVKIDKPIEINDSIIITEKEYFERQKKSSKHIDSIVCFFKESDFLKLIYKTKKVNKTIYKDSLKSFFNYDLNSEIITENRKIIISDDESKCKITIIDSIFEINSLVCKKIILNYEHFEYIVFCSDKYRNKNFANSLFAHGLIEPEIINVCKDFLIVKLIQKTNISSTEIVLNSFEEKKLDVKIFDLPGFYEDKNDRKFNKSSNDFKIYTLKDYKK